VAPPADTASDRSRRFPERQRSDSADPAIATEPGFARRPRLYLVEPDDSPFAQRIQSAALDAGLPVQAVAELSSVAPDASLVGVGPSAPNPLDVARELRRRSPQPLLVFFAASASARDALQAELVRDPFLYPRFELIEVPHSARQLAARLGRLIARIERQLHAAATARRRRPRSRSATVGRRPRSQGEHYLASVLAQATDAIISTDRQGRIRTWNEAAEKLFGMPASRVIGMPLSVLNPFQSVDSGIEAAARRVLASGQAEAARVSCRQGDRDGVEASASIAPVRDARGGLLGLSIVLRDESEYERIQAALEDANRQKDEFLAIMSHELRTPLTSILGYTDMLLRGLSGELAPMAHKYVGNVRSAGDRLLELVNGLLDFTRLEAGVEQLELQAVDLETVVSEQVKRWQPQAHAQDIELRLVIDGPIGKVQADAEKLGHVVRSYVGNALKFTSGPGLVEVRIANDPEVRTNVRVSVADSGVGMRQDQLARVWERFYQGDASLTRAYGGMGLGLSIARHLVKLHGGAVGAESRGPGLGSTFWFSLPRATSHAELGG
jgi:PAS domain S-box-containing protein